MSRFVEVSIGAAGAAGARPRDAGYTLRPASRPDGVGPIVRRQSLPGRTAP
jgi:hypothetical protein